MKEKIKCKKCGLLIDEDLKTCPYCGYNQDEESSEVKQDEIKEEKIVKENKVRFFDFPTREIAITPVKSIVLFLVGFVGLKMLGSFASVIFNLLPNLGFVNSINGQATINFVLYFFLFGILVLILNNDVGKFIGDFKKGRTYLNGVMYGFFMIVVSSAVGLIFRLFDTSAGVNSNEAGVDSITQMFPFLSFIIFGLIGPICEEFTYRAGLFNALKKINRYVAYFGTALIFGLIHFNFASFVDGTYITELINIPTYIVSGLLLCYFYEYGGLAASITAHATNNLFAVIIQIITGI